jgi:glycosyltransferase involved in cell wall biosynthesis
VVATDCPSGPAEILAGGRYGELVPLGDVARLAAAMARTLDQPLPADVLRARGAEFSLERSVARYLDLLLPAPGALAHA